MGSNICIYILHSFNENSFNLKPIFLFLSWYHCMILVLLIIKFFILSKNTHTVMADDSKGSGSNIKTIDPSHPFYIHHSNQSDHVLVPIKLSGINYHSWSKMVFHALIAKKKLNFFDHIIKQSSQDTQPFLFEQWNQCNNMILSWLTYTVKSDITKEIIHAKTTREVWVNLRDHFSQKRLL